ncbi:MAG TPA: Rrf2 family transcriptional regulator [Candidatus Binataceae bacterium]|jgi:Rrf2 family protein|nr:Rrf2 family transcriptional regulator [Candidatus Binataceae bacterium]
MISQKAKYALKALTVLAEEYGKGPILIADIAAREHIPRSFLELILLELKNHRFLDSRKGRGGGYFLAKSPAQISVGQVLRAIEGPLAPLPCVSKTAYRKCDECSDERTCAVRLLMRDVRDATARILDSTTLADLLKRSQLALHGREALQFSI